MACSTSTNRRWVKPKRVHLATTSSQSTKSTATSKPPPQNPAAATAEADQAPPRAVHREDRTAAGTDFDIAFELQLQEAIAASGSYHLGFTDNFFLYFKGLVVEDRDNNAKLGAIAVAIFNFDKSPVFEMSKPLVLPAAMMTDQVAELEAFILGLEFALSLEIRNLMFSYIDSRYPYLYGNKKPTEAKLAELVDRGDLLKKRFVNCHSFAATPNNAKHVLELARTSIAKQAGKPYKEIKILTRENCAICLEDVESKKMLKISGCHHRFCYSCLKTHVKLEVRGRQLPHCPQPNCKRKIDIEACRNFLTQEMYEIFSQVAKESSIPASEKVYCPNPKCSYLMSKIEALADSQSLAGQCTKCRLSFCINCKVPWHTNMSCVSYKKHQLYWNPSSVDVAFDALVAQKKWKQCPKCSHMVELACGCNHIYCRCGHQFCYVCAREWKDRKATCSCPLWFERNIIFRGH